MPQKCTNERASPPFQRKLALLQFWMVAQFPRFCCPSPDSQLGVACVGADASIRPILPNGTPTPRRGLESA